MKKHVSWLYNPITEKYFAAILEGSQLRLYNYDGVNNDDFLSWGRRVDGDIIARGITDNKIKLVIPTI